MVTDLQKDLIIERSKSKVQNMTPAWEEEIPLEETSGSELFFDHARGQVERLRNSYQMIGRKAQGVGDALFCIRPWRDEVDFRFARGCSIVIQGEWDIWT